MPPFAPRDPRNHPFRFTMITATILGPFLSWMIGALFGNFLFRPWGQPQGVMLRFFGVGGVAGVGLGMLIAYLLRNHPTSPIRWIILSTMTVAIIMGGLGWVVETTIRAMTMPL